MDALRIPVVKMGGYLKAILPSGQETVFGRDEKELVGRLRFRAAVLGVHPERIILPALAIGGRVRDGNGRKRERTI
jgi:hypothetical protein